MKIYTGYFSKTKEYLKQNYYPVSIAAFPPKGWAYGSASKVFAPPKELLSAYKNNQLLWHDYDEKYLKNLQKQDRFIPSFFSFYEKLCQEKKYDGIVLLCYEKNPEECHRSLLAEYLNQQYLQSLEEPIKECIPLQKEKEEIDRTEE